MRVFSTPVFRPMAVMLLILAWSTPVFCGPIHDAAQSCDVIRASALLNESPDLVSSKGLGSRTPLHFAAKAGCREIAEMLIARGADADARSSFNITPLHDAAWRGSLAIAELLIAHGANVRAKDNHGYTALHYAAVQCRADVAELLIAHGADIEARDKFGVTPLHAAAIQGGGGVTESLLGHGADVNARDIDGMTAMHTAAKQGRRDAAEPLLAHGADVNARDRFGLTPLHYAANGGRRDMVEWLLAHGADINARNKHGMTALAYAVRQGHKNIEDLLRARKAGLGIKELIGSRSSHWETKPFEPEGMIFIIISVLPSILLFFTGKKQVGISLAAIMAALLTILFLDHPDSITNLILLAGSLLWLVQIPYIAIVIMSGDSPLGKSRSEAPRQGAPSGISSAPLTPGGSSISPPQKIVSKSTMLLIAAMVIIAGIIASAASDSALGRKMAILCMIAGVAVVFAVDSNLEKKRRGEQTASDAKRADELFKAVKANEVSSTHQIVPRQGSAGAVFGSSGIVAGSALLLVALFILSLVFKHGLQETASPIVLSLGALFFLFMGSIATLTAIPSLGGKPLLRLSGQGLYSPAYGSISWSDVRGISMRELSARGLKIGHLLSFNVPRLPELVNQFHPAAGFLYKLRLSRGGSKTVIAVVLRKTNETPDTIYRVARQLWREATGRDATWHPGMSPEVSAAWERLDGLRPQVLDEMSRGYNHSPRQYEQLTEAYADSLKDDPAAYKDLEVIKKDAKKSTSIPNIIIVIVMLCILGLKLIPLLKRLFG